MEDLGKLMQSLQDDLNSSLNEINKHRVLEQDSDFFKPASEAELQTDNDRSLQSDFFTEENASEENETMEFSGVVFTDIAMLAEKYSVSIKQIATCIYEYINDAGGAGVRLHLADISQVRINRDSICDWKFYYQYLQDVLDHLGINSPDKTVFIIGGEDVIPMPRIKNPLRDIGSEYIDADMRYCFGIVNEDIDNISALISRPRCNIGRFPLETGPVQGDFNTELKWYLGYTPRLWSAEGIDVKGAVMTTTESWIPSSREMMRDIPSFDIESDILTIKKNMLISPEIDLEDPAFEREYTNKINGAGFLIFNLHGSNEPDASAYFGENKRHCHFPQAFKVDKCSELVPQIITSTACYGARYIGYPRSKSMLLSAMEAGTLLFVGSCTTALGRGNGDTATDLLIPAGMSESMLKLYNTYLCLGHPAGMALLEAKMDYYHTCSNIDGNDSALATIMMFNLYGDPRLFMKAKLDEDLEEKTMKNSVLANDTELRYRPKEFKTIYNRNFKDNSDILSMVSHLVENNLSEIHNIIQEKLYQTIGMERKYLESITEFNENGNKQGFSYTYRKKEGVLERIVIAKTDSKGNLLDVITSK